MPLTVIPGGAPGTAKPCPHPANDPLPPAALAAWRRQAIAIVARLRSTPDQRALALRFLRQHGARGAAS
jgi:hypothetical protein